MSYIGSYLLPNSGGTGVQNNTASTFTISGNFPLTATLTGATNVTFPTSGTLATTGSLPTPAALTATSDTNVTLTLGGTPSTALLEASSITAGWSGTLSLARGGTAANLTASNGGIFYSTASGGAILTAASVAGHPLLSGANAAPSWSLTSFPSTIPINNLYYASASNVISALATANNGCLVTSSGGVPSISSTLPTAVQQSITTIGTISTTTTIAGGQVVRVNPQSGNYSATATDYIIGCTGTASTAQTITLPATTVAGQVYIVKDQAGAANTNNITITAGGTTLIDGNTAAVINQAFASVTIYANAASGQYFIM